MISYKNKNEMMLLSCLKNYDSHNFNNDLIVSNRDMRKIHQTRLKDTGKPKSMLYQK